MGLGLKILSQYESTLIWICHLADVFLYETETALSTHKQDWLIFDEYTTLGKTWSFIEIDKFWLHESSHQNFNISPGVSKRPLTLLSELMIFLKQKKQKYHDYQNEKALQFQ